VAAVVVAACLVASCGTAVPDATDRADDAARADVTSSAAPSPVAAEPVARRSPPRNRARADDLLVHQVYVTTRVDTDRDGRRDVVRVVVARPPSRLVRGRRVATVAQASPYFSCCVEVDNHDVDVPLRGPRPAVTDHMLAGLREEGARWARRGYAYARVASLGSNRSTGCPTVGDSAEAAGVVALVDWLNGRAVGRDPRGRRVRAGWATGSTGLAGTSYDGTLPNMAAVTGVRGLRAIVPISAISSWYDYYRQDGLVVAPGGYQGEDVDVLARFDYTRRDQRICRPVIADLGRRQDRRTGDHSAFWAARDLRARASRVRAAVLVAHGFGDDNTKPDQAALWFAALRRAGVPSKIWWDQGGHGTPVPERLVVRWMDRFLYGVPNGVAGGPAAAVRTGERTRWYATWPRPGSRARVYGVDGAALRPGSPSAGTPTSFTDDPRLSAAAVCKLPAAAHSARFTTGPLPRGLDLSGSPVARLRLAFDRPASNVTAALCVTTAGGASRLLTRGFADPQNVDSLTDGVALAPGRSYDVRVRLQPLDQRLPDGARVSLLVMASDHDFTLRPPPGTTVTVDPAGTSVSLPVVG
jgi:X-Pro dipeptidyl-peptidase